MIKFEEVIFFDLVFNWNNFCLTQTESNINKSPQIEVTCLG